MATLNSLPRPLIRRNPLENLIDDLQSEKNIVVVSSKKSSTDDLKRSNHIFNREVAMRKSFDSFRFKSDFDHKSPIRIDGKENDERVLNLFLDNSAPKLRVSPSPQQEKSQGSQTKRAQANNNKLKLREILKKLKIKKSELNNALKLYDLEKVKLKEKRISVLHEINSAAEEYVKKDENSLKQSSGNVLAQITFIQNIEIKVETLVEKNEDISTDHLQDYQRFIEEMDTANSRTEPFRIQIEKIKIVSKNDLDNLERENLQLQKECSMLRNEIEKLRELYSSEIKFDDFTTKTGVEGLRNILSELKNGLQNEILNIGYTFGISDLINRCSQNSGKGSGTDFDFSSEIECLSILKASLEEKIGVLKSELQTTKDEAVKREREHRAISQEQIKKASALQAMLENSINLEEYKILETEFQREAAEKGKLRDSNDNLRATLSKLNEEIENLRKHRIPSPVSQRSPQNFRNELLRDFERLKEENTELVKKLEICNQQIFHFIQLKDELEKNTPERRNTSVSFVNAKERERHDKIRAHKHNNSTPRECRNLVEACGLSAVNIQEHFEQKYSELEKENAAERQHIVDKYELRINDLEITNKQLQQALDSHAFRDSVMDLTKTQNAPYLFNENENDIRYPNKETSNKKAKTGKALHLRNFSMNIKNQKFKNPLRSGSLSKDYYTSSGELVDAFYSKNTNLEHDNKNSLRFSEISSLEKQDDYQSSERKHNVHKEGLIEFGKETSKRLIGKKNIEVSPKNNLRSPILKREEINNNDSKILIMTNNSNDDSDISSSLFSSSSEIHNMTLTNTSQDERKNLYSDRCLFSEKPKTIKFETVKEQRLLENKFVKKANSNETPEIKVSRLDNSVNEKSTYRTPESHFTSSGFEFKVSVNEFGLRSLGTQTDQFDEDIFPPFDHRVCLRCKKNDLISPNHCRFNNIQSIRDISSFNSNTKSNFKVYDKHRYGVNIGFKCNDRVNSVKRDAEAKARMRIPEPPQCIGINTIICNKDFL